MKCPQCSKEIVYASGHCNACGHEFDTAVCNKLSSYFELKNQIEDLCLIRDRFSRGLENTLKQLQYFERFLENDIKSTFLKEKTEDREPLKPTEGIPVEDEQASGSQRFLLIENTETTATDPIPQPSSAAFHKQDSPDMELRIGQKWLLIIGVVTMVFGVGYFLKYSFERGWVGPAGRVTMAYVWAAAFLIMGDRFRKKDMAVFGLYLLGGGISVLYFATFAGFQIYRLFDQSVSFSVMALVTILAGVLSIVYDTKWLAVLGIIGGFLTPILLSTGQDNQIALMTYMTILNLGLLGIALYKRWVLLNVLGFVFTYLLYTAWFFRHYQDSKFWPALIFLNIYFVIYNFIPFAYHFIKTSSDEMKGLYIMVLNAVIAFGFGHYLISNRISIEWVSVITILYAANFLIMASYLYKREALAGYPFAALLGISLVFLIITVPVLFSKHWITNFWAAQSLALLWMGLRLNKKSLIYGSYLLLFMVIGKFFFIDYPSVFLLNPDISYAQSYTYLLLERYITSLLLLTIIYTFATMTRNAGLSSLPNIKDSALLFTLMGIIAFIIANIETAALFYHYLPQARFTAITVLWTIFSVFIMIQGFRYNSSLIRKVSLALFLATVIKVFFFDISRFSTPYRIISFIILGLILIAASYLYHRFKDRIIEAMKVEKI